MLPATLQKAFPNKKILDFGIGIEPNTFSFGETSCVVPTSLVMNYAIAMASSGGATRILMAGFDGYGVGDTRNDEVESSLAAYEAAPNHVSLLAVTETGFRGLPTASVYAL